MKLLRLSAHKAGGGRNPEGAYGVLSFVASVSPPPSKAEQVWLEQEVELALRQAMREQESIHEKLRSLRVEKSGSRDSA